MYHMMKFDDFNPDEEEADLNRYPSQRQPIPIHNRTQQSQNTFTAQMPSLSLHSMTVNPTSTKISGRSLPLQIDEELLKPIISFFKSQTNYDCMPTSCKVMVFDFDLPIREAFTIAARNGKPFSILPDQ